MMLYLGKEPNWVDRSLKHRTAIAWNSLPDKQLENPLSFKKKDKIDQDPCQGHQFPKGMHCKL